MFNPTATYRIQFHKDFTFSDFERIIPYLARLGVSTVYASPILEAVPGSKHGYDVVNPGRINPEIGTLEQFRKISQKLRELGISWLQDIVPNHMAFHRQNSWLMDVLENGRGSLFASFFDIFWQAEGFKDKVMVPVLGAAPGQIIAEGQLSVALNEGGLSFSYAEHSFPLNAPSYAFVFRGTPNLPAALKAALATPGAGPEHLTRAKTLLLKAAKQGKWRPGIEEAIREINSDPQRLQQLLDEQYYTLRYWKESDSRINYRRFFTVNSLICLNMQQQKVFEEYHSFIKSMIDEGLIQGLRVDHIDGLFDPTQYLERLRRLAGDTLYIIVEKILEPGEEFPKHWPVQGSTGYDFLAQVNNLLTANENKYLFTSFYHSLVKTKIDLPDAIAEKKAAILRDSMGGELNNLHQLFFGLRLDQGQALSPEDHRQLKTAIGLFLVHCPVYRFYGNQLPLPSEEQRSVRKIFNRILSADPSLKKAVGLLKKVFFYTGEDNGLRAGCLWFYQRCMQFAGPLMAKGVEDTLMYTYDRFLGHNEVGDSPDAFGIEAAVFHRQMVKRQQQIPLSLSATSTHDTKRGEDVRARLNVLTDKGEDWIKTVKKWLKINKSLKSGRRPDSNDEYLIYQTLAGCYPLPGGSKADLEERLKAYLTKALREAKVHSGWAEPDDEYEKRSLNFLGKLLGANGEFLKSFTNLQNALAELTVINSLTQLMLKFTCPGVPDVYQGCELWDFSLVDPDNRRPVDYRSRADAAADDETLFALWQNRYSGKIKLWLTSLLFRLRRDTPDLFSKGAYIPLKIKGKYKNNLIAFARQHQKDWLITAVPLHLAALDYRSDNFDWQDTRVVLPENAPVEWTSLLTGDQELIQGQVNVGRIFRAAPLALLRSRRPGSKRGAGVILHITSLPSPFTTGDMGPEARKFGNFLWQGGQKYWQLLPINPASAPAQFSPYSSCSSMAGNTLLISPEDLVRDRWLTAADIQRQQVAGAGICDFKRAVVSKEKLFERAFSNFSKYADKHQLAEYQQFAENEAYWLDDFSVYEALKRVFKGKPWYKWAAEYKFRDSSAIKEFKANSEAEIAKSKWLQYIFVKQWTVLKTHLNALGIKTIGDLPFYVSYDSADVWANRDLFKLDKLGNMAALAGVPPDYFSVSGQLWGMPVYRWQGHEKTGFQWWRKRLCKNLEFFDLLRLDHFRAFFDFWEVPAGEKTAIHGSWQPGPGAALFRAFDPDVSHLPFIAEDLGAISEGVYHLREELGLPGMNVLQYAFGQDMSLSVHAPHNHKNLSVTYTGTHDNNTTVGWLKNDASKMERRNLEQYSGTKVNKINVHQVMTDLCYRSAADIAMVPLQDILGLDQQHRMNRPSATKNNWTWRLEKERLTPLHALWLARLAKKYNR